MSKTKSYQIKTYKPEYTDLEVELVKEFQERKQLQRQFLWYPHQAAIDNLKTQREPKEENNFKPENHWYLFSDEELIGFIHGYPQENTKRYGLSIIPTKAGYEHEAHKLFDKLLESAKEKDYEVLVKNASDNHTVDLAFLKQFGFEKIRLRNMRSFVPIENIKVVSNSMYTLETFDEEKHREKVINELYLPKGYDRERMDAQMDGIKQLQENGQLLSWIVATQGEEVVGQSLAFIADPNIPDVIQFNAVTNNFQGEEALPVINAIYAKHFEVLPETIRFVDNFLFPQVKEDRELYEKIGFKYNENHTYEKQI